MSETKLQQAQRHVWHGRNLMERQQCIVAELERCGREDILSQARSALATMLALHALFEAHLAELEQHRSRGI